MSRFSHWQQRICFWSTEVEVVVNKGNVCVAWILQERAIRYIIPSAWVARVNNPPALKMVLLVTIILAYTHLRKDSQKSDYVLFHSFWNMLLFEKTDQQFPEFRTWSNVLHRMFMFPNYCQVGGSFSYLWWIHIPRDLHSSIWARPAKTYALLHTFYIGTQKQCTTADAKMGIQDREGIGNGSVLHGYKNVQKGAMRSFVMIIHMTDFPHQHWSLRTSILMRSSMSKSVLLKELELSKEYKGFHLPSLELTYAGDVCYMHVLEWKLRNPRMIRGRV